MAFRSKKKEEVDILQDLLRFGFSRMIVYIRRGARFRIKPVGVSWQ